MVTASLSSHPPELLPVGSGCGHGFKVAWKPHVSKTHSSKKANNEREMSAAVGR